MHICAAYLRVHICIRNPLPIQLLYTLYQCVKFAYHTKYSSMTYTYITLWYMHLIIEWQRFMQLTRYQLVNSIFICLTSMSIAFHIKHALNFLKVQRLTAYTPCLHASLKGIRVQAYRMQARRMLVTVIWRNLKRFTIYTAAYICLCTNIYAFKYANCWLSLGFMLFFFKNLSSSHLASSIWLIYWAY